AGRPAGHPLPSCSRTPAGATVPIQLDVRNDMLRLAQPFHITGHVFHHVPVCIVELRDGAAVGRGEAAGVYYNADLPLAMPAQIETLRAEIEAGLDRETLRQRLPPGGARNAIDCALWALESQRSGRPVWQRAGLESVRPLLTTFTVGVDTPEAMATRALSYREARAIKLKLNGEVDLDIARVRAVRAARPEVWI